MPGEVCVLIGDREFAVQASSPLRFGRIDRDDVVGLDPNDMGISTVAGSVQHEWAVWWLENHSRKRPLLLGDGSGGVLRVLDCGRRTAIADRHLTVLVPGAIHTHTVEVVVPMTALGGFGHRIPPSAAGAHGLRLSERDKDVLVTLLSDYLDGFPTRRPVSRSYQEVADLLGPPWTRASVRRRLAQLRQRAARAGPRFTGPQANYDLVDHLVVNSLLVPADRNRFSRST